MVLLSLSSAHENTFRNLVQADDDDDDYDIKLSTN